MHTHIHTRAHAVFGSNDGHVTNSGFFKQELAEEIESLSTSKVGA